VPRLRERSRDIAPLTLPFIEKSVARKASLASQISREILERLAQHDWPSNVRQLENGVEKAVVLSG